MRYESLVGVNQARVVGTSRCIEGQVRVDTPKPDTIETRPILGCDVGITAPVALSSGVQCPQRHRD